jgi:hypothetical protein
VTASEGGRIQIPTITLISGCPATQLVHNTWIHDFLRIKSDSSCRFASRILHCNSTTCASMKCRSCGRRLSSSRWLLVGAAKSGTSIQDCLQATGCLIIEGFLLKLIYVFLTSGALQVLALDQTTRGDGTICGGYKWRRHTLALYSLIVPVVQGKT